MPDRKRTFTPDHRKHLGEARRDGTSYTPLLTHADIDAAVGRSLASEQGRDAAVKAPAIVLPNTDSPSETPERVDLGAPCNVTGLTIDHGGNGNNVWVDISWTRGTCANNGARFEVMLVRTDDPLEAQFPIVRTTTDLSIRFESLEPVTPYEVTVYAISRISMRSSGTTDSFTSSADDTVPSDVTGLTMSAGLRTIVLSWNDVADSDVINGNGTYEIQIALDSGFSSGLRTVRKSGTVASFGDLSPGVLYYGRIRAIDSSGNASDNWSSTVSAITAQAGTSDIAADAITANHITAGAITADELAASSVTTAKLNADAVTAAKLSSIELEVGKYIASTTYSAGTTGWRINASGSAEFNNVTVRGTVISDSFQTAASGARVRMGSALTAADEVQFIGSSGGIGSIRNGQFITGFSNSMRLSAGGIIDIYYDGTNRIVMTAGGGITLGGECNITSGGLLFSGNTVINSSRQGFFSSLAVGFDTWTAGSFSSSAVACSTLQVTSTAAFGVGTTASSANARIDPTFGTLARSTSSGRFKADVRSVRQDFNTEVIFSLAPVSYLSRLTPQDLGGIDEPNRRYISLVAEDVAAVAPALADVDDDGKPVGINWNGLTTFLLAEVQRLRKDVDALSN